ncbi:hypothetical protein K0I63_00340 [Shewanella rhizosphaerae]|uniref:hypothetical protein n=1 Tax=Shewanella rhizosphaerae TaxID=2864207 RepID=UPI001C65C59D|nr:hypothetical protein [Shewanella rhizosphaerae]QYK13020.1 hypothetical protein K0I63_00340 [Shewanella rhizosphaerae]
MKLKLAFVGLALSMGISFAATATSPAQCRAEFMQCVESGTLESYCETQYVICRGY